MRRCSTTAAGRCTAWSLRRSRRCTPTASPSTSRSSPATGSWPRSGRRRSTTPSEPVTARRRRSPTSRPSRSTPGVRARQRHSASTAAPHRSPSVSATSTSPSATYPVRNGVRGDGSGGARGWRRHRTGVGTDHARRGQLLRPSASTTVKRSLPRRRTSRTPTATVRLYAACCCRPCATVHARHEEAAELEPRSTAAPHVGDSPRTLRRRPRHEALFARWRGDLGRPSPSRSRGT